MVKAAIIQGLPQMPRDQCVKFLCAESTKEMMGNTITPHCVNKFFKIVHIFWVLYPFFARCGPVVCLYTYLGNVQSSKTKIVWLHSEHLGQNEILLCFYGIYNIVKPSRRNEVRKLGNRIGICFTKLQQDSSKVSHFLLDKAVLFFSILLYQQTNWGRSSRNSALDDIFERTPFLSFFYYEDNC